MCFFRVMESANCEMQEKWNLPFLHQACLSVIVGIFSMCLCYLSVWKNSIWIRSNFPQVFLGSVWLCLARLLKMCLWISGMFQISCQTLNSVSCVSYILYLAMYTVYLSKYLPCECVLLQAVDRGHFTCLYVLLRIWIWFKPFSYKIKHLKLSFYL